MTTDEILTRLSQLSGLPISSLMLFCKNNSIAYTNLNNWYIKIGRMPTQSECAKIRQGGDTFIDQFLINK